MGAAALSEARWLGELGTSRRGATPPAGRVVQVPGSLVRVRCAQHPAVAPFAPELDLGAGRLDRARRVDVLVRTLGGPLPVEDDEVRHVVGIGRDGRADRAREAVRELDLAGEDLLGSEVKPGNLGRTGVVVLVDAGGPERLARHDLEVARLVGPDDDRRARIERRAEVRVVVEARAGRELERPRRRDVRHSVSCDDRVWIVSTQIEPTVVLARLIGLEVTLHLAACGDAHGGHGDEDGALLDPHPSSAKRLARGAARRRGVCQEVVEIVEVQVRAAEELHPLRDLRLEAQLEEAARVDEVRARVAEDRLELAGRQRLVA